MPLTLTEQKEWQLQAYGCTEETLLKSKPEYYTNLSYAFSILSDAQESLQFSKEQSRQFINRAKFFIELEIPQRY